MCEDLQLVGVGLIKVMLMLQCVVVATSSSLGNQQIVVEGAIGVCNGAATLKLTEQNITRGS